jgi:hypothetical protein
MDLHEVLDKLLFLQELGEDQQQNLGKRSLSLSEHLRHLHYHEMHFGPYLYHK